AAASVSHALGIYGTQATFSTACSSSALAVALAADAIRRGEARIALALGADGLCRLTYAGFDALQALDPDRCRPFDRDRRGLSLGEGAAALVLEDAEHARARGVRARAAVLGHGTATDAHHPTAPHPEGRGALAALRTALAAAELPPEAIDYVNAHGTGVVSALGHGVEPFWRGLVAGASGLRPIRRFEVPPGVALGGEVPPVERREVVLTAIGRRIDWVSLMALAACRLALADAGLGPGALEPVRTGLGLGSAWGNLQETAAFLDRLFARGQGNPLLFPNLVFNAPLSYASIELGITGPTAMLSAEEASGEAAIAWGAEQVGEGAVDVCLAGGADELGAVLHQVLREGRLLARAAPRPLDPAADGAWP